MQFGITGNNSYYNNLKTKYSNPAEKTENETTQKSIFPNNKPVNYIAEEEQLQEEAEEKASEDIKISSGSYFVDSKEENGTRKAFKVLNAYLNKTASTASNSEELDSLKEFYGKAAKYFVDFENLSQEEASTLSQEALDDLKEFYGNKMKNIINSGSSEQEQADALGDLNILYSEITNYYLDCGGMDIHDYTL